MKGRRIRKSMGVEDEVVILMKFEAFIRIDGAVLFDIREGPGIEGVLELKKGLRDSRVGPFHMVEKDIGMTLNSGKVYPGWVSLDVSVRGLSAMGVSMSHWILTRVGPTITVTQISNIHIHRQARPLVNQGRNSGTLPVDVKGSQ